MINKADAEQALRAAVGGATPNVGDTLEFTEKGWRFRKRARYLGTLASDPSEPEDGDFWFNSLELRLKVRVSGATRESPAFT